MSAADYRTQSVGRIGSLDAAHWDALLEPNAGGAVFLCHAWLSALEDCGCVGPGTGWLAHHLILRSADGGLAAAAPRYQKLHSYGEYVFDWAWADAYERHGLAYYPKWLSAVPFTPVEGPRLLTREPSAARELLAALLSEAQTSSMSSLHSLFATPQEIELMGQAGMMIRRGVQFRWSNRGYRDFDDFLSNLTQSKRKKIRAERRQVAQAGVRCERLAGAEISSAHWRLFHACYQATYAAHHSSPYLNLAFFEQIGRTMAQACRLNIAWRGDEAIAASLLICDSQRIYGRYWGALDWVPCLHFELAYYQSIETAIECGHQYVEGGAQGEHKLARGFEPIATASAHWLAEPAFADAVDDFLQREGAMMAGYLDELTERRPFKKPV